LSADTQASIPVVLPGIHTDVRLTRSEFEEMIRPPLVETVGAVRRALRSAKLEPGQVDKVLLVGGSSRIPLVAEVVGAALGRPIAVDAHPKNSVALGAAVAAAASASPSSHTGAVPVPPPAPLAPTDDDGGDRSADPSGPAPAQAATGAAADPGPVTSGGDEPEGPQGVGAPGTGTPGAPAGATADAPAAGGAGTAGPPSGTADDRADDATELIAPAPPRHTTPRRPGLDPRPSVVVPAPAVPAPVRPARPPAGSPTPRYATAPAAPAARSEQPRRRRRRRRGRGVAAAVTILLLLAAIAAAATALVVTSDDEPGAGAPVVEVDAGPADLPRELEPWPHVPRRDSRGLRPR
jgi:hypothetical protein